MEPIEKEKPGIGLFVLMTAVYFGAYFGLKYGVFDGELPWYSSLLLIVGCLALAFFLRRRLGRR